jgi:hypothetical protein
MEDIIHLLQPQAFHHLLTEEGENLDLLVRKSLLMGLGIEAKKYVTTSFILRECRGRG